MLSPAEKNPGTSEFWNGVVSTYWLNRQQAFDMILAPIGTATMDRARIGLGDRVIDLGCGCGSSTIEIAKRVGERGRILGVDLSQSMLARAAEQISTYPQIELVAADAATYDFPANAYSVLYSRVGCMFFPDPVKAFANIHSGMERSARLALACFRTPQESPYLFLPLQAVRQFVPPRPAPGPEDPGMFSFSSEERVRRILDLAGFENIALEPVDLELDLAAGNGLQAAVENSMELGIAGTLLLEQPLEIKRSVEQAIRIAFKPYQKNGEVRLTGGFWIVTATAR